jgi:hypothetical protein
VRPIHAIDEADILLTEPAGEMRPQLQRVYPSTGELVAEYLRLRRGELFEHDAPVARGELVDLELELGGRQLILHGTVIDRRGPLALIEAITGRFTDKLLARVLG